MLTATAETGYIAMGGGGVFLQVGDAFSNDTTVTFSRCMLTNNNAGGWQGGGVCLMVGKDEALGSTVAFEDCTFESNNAGRFCFYWRFICYYE